MRNSSEIQKIAHALKYELIGLENSINRFLLPRPKFFVEMSPDIDLIGKAQLEVYRDHYKCERIKHFARYFSKHYFPREATFTY